MRKPGFYWVKRCGHFSVAEYMKEHYWHWGNTLLCVGDNYFDWISSEPLIPPEA